ncbi:hypothetical protein F5Y14DRAFT_372613 [Nemania sp. NC0429]|nr:hypothetical protein F5Y14DRAFT_372613 [Nemania sp. NC0429]
MTKAVRPSRVLRGRAFNALAFIFILANPFLPLRMIPDQPTSPCLALPNRKAPGLIASPLIPKSGTHFKRLGCKQNCTNQNVLRYF